MRILMSALLCASACGRFGFEPTTSGGDGDANGGGDGDGAMGAVARLELLAGIPGMCGFRDGAGAQALFRQPRGVVVDSAGNVYVGERFNRCVRRLDLATGATSRFAGICSPGTPVDGTDGIARFGEIGGIALDESAGRLIVADGTGQAIRAVALSNRSVTTLAGQLGVAGYVEGAGTTARFNFPANVDIDAQGRVYIADATNHRIRRLDGTTSVFVAGGGAGYGNTDDPSSTDVNEPIGVAVDAQYVYWTEPFGNIVRRMELATGQIRWVAGQWFEGYTDGIEGGALMSHPEGLVTDRQGTLYIADRNNGAIRKVDVATNEVTTLVGTPGTQGLVLGPLPGNLLTPYALALAPTGELVIADHDQCAIFVVRPGQ